MAKRRRRHEDDHPIVPSCIRWSEVGPPGKLPIEIGLRLHAGFTYNVRLFHKPIRFWRQVNPDDTGRIVAFDSAEQKRPGLLLRYAINVIDRADAQIKVMEGSEDLFVRFRRCHEITGIELGGSDAFDLTIRVAGDGAARKYHVSFDATIKNPFTDAEKAKLRSEVFDLPTIFRASQSS